MPGSTDVAQSEKAPAMSDKKSDPMKKELDAAGSSGNPAEKKARARKSDPKTDNRISSLLMKIAIPEQRKKKYRMQNHSIPKNIS